MAAQEFLLFTHNCEISSVMLKMLLQDIHALPLPLSKTGIQFNIGTYLSSLSKCRRFGGDRGLNKQGNPPHNG